MDKTKLIGWDLGGAEGPHDPKYTVVDIQDIPDYVQEVAGHTRGHYDFRKIDLRKQGWYMGMVPRAFVKVGQLIRYLDDEGGYLNGEPFNPGAYKSFGQGIGQIWDYLYIGKEGKPSIVLFDHAALIEWVLMGILDIAHRENWPELKIETDWVNPPDEDLPGDWQITITLA